jgi:hypothetical protein
MSVAKSRRAANKKDDNSGLIGDNFNIEGGTNTIDPSKDVSVKTAPKHPYT